MSQVSIIDIEANNPQIPTSFITDTGTGAIPIANVLEILGSYVPAGVLPVYTSGSGNTVTTNVQISQAIASSNALNVGLAAFDSSQFTVDANGFVTLNGGAGGAVTSIQVQANTAPGTDSVVPSSGVVTINGAAVANHSVVLETRSRAANAFNVEVQYATTAAATDSTKSGVSHFDSSQFTVDANGFVQINSGVGGVTIAGDSGSLTGSSITIYANNATRKTGSSVYFTNSGTTSTFTLSDASYNIFLGRFAGTLANSSAECVGIGYASMYQTQTSQKTSCFGSNSGYALTQDTNNTAIGAYSLNRLTTGSTNACLGYLAGNSYTSSESSNICLLSTGTLGESNTIRIGTQGSGAGQQNTAYIAGIVGVTVSNPVLTTINSSTGQLGVIASSNSSVLTTGATGVPTLTALATDGQLIIGSTSGAPAAATLTAGTGISITNGSNSISIAVSGSGVGQTITGNSGGALSPTAGNWNIVTANSTVKFVGSGSTLTQDFGLTNLLIGSSGAITTGGANVSLGLASLALTTTGGSNTAIGSSSMAANVGGAANTAIGNQTLNSFNPGAGPTFTYNTALGDIALSNLTTGTYNTCLGVNSGFNYTTSESSNVLIRNTGTIGESNTIRIGTQGSGVGQQLQTHIAGVINTVSGRVVKITTPGAYPYTTLTTDYVILVDTSSARTITPLAAPVTGTTYRIKDSVGSAAANNITITPSGKNIDGAASTTININYGSVDIVYNGTEWSIL